MRFFSFVLMHIALISIFVVRLPAQGLFDEAVGGDSKKKQPYELNGYIRGVFYEGKVPGKDEVETKSGYAEASIELKVHNELGDGFAEISYRSGYELGDNVSEVDLREAYVNAYLGKFDFRIGKQIVVWGRADGINPTNNITPQNMLVRSPDEDDRREGNFLVRSYLNLQPIRFEAIWVPVYRSSVIPMNPDFMPANLKFGEADYPDANFKNSALAAKINLELASLDGSLSYFNGYNTFPGMDAEQNVTPDGNVEIILRQKPYKMHVLGVDFSTAVGSLFGLRGEFAYRKPHEDYEKNVYIPNPDLQYVLGVDKGIGDISILIQYVGRYVLDFTDLPVPQNPAEMPNYEITLNNRIFSSQQNEISHSVFFRPAWTLLHETFSLELAGMYNITTKELLLRPKVSYDIADALTVTAGGELYSGPEETLFDKIDSQLSAFYVELKSSF